ncbi:multiple organellar RNA editing factor 8, chloroplastic/mitochondrial-like [Rutidosis leptorrhynchoides]|uniref:multiple organellar RNA editing factor 8, chloroplastic/mitochondrial-like n=1 Tax=Rutidosis leptorrhynchoides TaxID=125765 RepID=UPI003A9A5F5D
MATRVAFRSLTSATNQTLISRISTTTTIITPSSIPRFRPLIAAATASFWYLNHHHHTLCTYRTRSLVQHNDYVNERLKPPPKKHVLSDENGCDFEHWLVIVDKPEGEPTRDEIIDSYINKLANVVGSYDAARMKIYSVSTRYYYAFGARINLGQVLRLEAVYGVRRVLHDSYLDVKNKDYGGEPFIDGKAVPYDPKYHEAWIKKENKTD